MSRIDSMILAQLAAVKASADALGGQVGALMETLKLLNTGLAGPDGKPRCPKCGSPKYVDLTSPGEPVVYQCLDCHERYNPGGKDAPVGA